MACRLDNASKNVHDIALFTYGTNDFGHSECSGGKGCNCKCQKGVRADGTCANTVSAPGTRMYRTSLSNVLFDLNNIVGKE